MHYHLFYSSMSTHLCKKYIWLQWHSIVYGVFVDEKDNVDNVRYFDEYEDFDIIEFFNATKMEIKHDMN